MLKKEWFNGDEDAVRMCEILCFIGHALDDVEDCEFNGSAFEERDRFKNAFFMLLIDLQTNKTFQEHKNDLMPMIKVSLLNWEVANLIEKDADDHGLEISHCLRYGIASVFCYISMVKCGYNKAIQYSNEIWRFVVNERFQPYKEEHQNASKSI